MTSSPFYDLLDLACGHGFASLYSLIAGAREVYALDTNVEVLNQFRAKTLKIKKFLPESTRINTQFKPKVRDVLQAKNYQDLPKPDVILCFNFLPFLSPVLQKEFIEMTYKNVGSGGICFFLGDCLYGNDSWREPLLKRVELKHPTPGYCWLDDYKPLPEFPNPDTKVAPGAYFRTDQYPGKVITMRNFLHPQPFKQMLKEIGIPQENVDIFYEGGAYSFPRLIPEATFDGDTKQRLQMAVILRKPEVKSV